MNPAVFLKGDHLLKARIILLLLLLCTFAAFSGADADVLINEIMASNGTYENGHAYDWVELYNSGAETVNIGGWGLSDSKSDLYRFSFPEGTKIRKNSYLTVFCTGEATEGSKGDKSVFYAEFKVSASGEKIRLTDAEGNIRDTVELPQQYGNISYGRAGDGSGYGYFENATRGKKNDQKVFAERVAEPLLLTAGGFYHDSVRINVKEPAGSVIRYTTDGETPSENSKVFPAEGIDIKKTTVLRLRAFTDGMLPSGTTSATYFINDDPVTPVVSLVSDDRYLFSKKTGILTKGTGSIPNYSKGWEYPVNIEYYDDSGTCMINQMGTFTCSGHSARVNSQKSIALYARKAWGPDRFEFDPFPTRNYGSYKSLLLRAANSDTYATRLRDVVASSLAEGQDILYQDYVVIQVYINGRYWGHYNLREKINKYFIAQYEGITEEKDIDNIDILARTGTDQFLQNGDNTDWLALCDFCKKNDLNDPAAFEYVDERLDIDNLFTHAAYEIILGNVDFTNVRVYRVPGGKWRYLLFDVEACWRGIDKTPIEYYIKPVNGKIQGFRHEPLNALLNVPEMKAKFLRRVSDLLTGVFRWDHVETHFNAVTDILEQILPRHIERWKNMKIANWKKNVNATKYYARVRPKKIPDLLQKAMKLTDEEKELYFGEAVRLLNETNTK